jgi:phosphoribosyl 1,2-cyclic phosphodiesterase
MGVRLTPLGSGSRGNAALLEAGQTKLLIDAGLSARALAQRLDAVGVAPESVDAILLSHEHSDHTRGAERFSRKHGTTVVCSIETLAAMDLSPRHFERWVALPDGGSLEVGNVTVEHFPIPHDAARPVGFRLRAEGLCVGVATDLGHATTLVAERLRGCHMLMIESNHDEEMLRNGPYPWQLKQRVSGRMGHLSNDETAALLREIVAEDCGAVVLAHLSEKNNTPELARKCASAALVRAGVKRVAMRVASPTRPTPAVEL